MHDVLGLSLRGDLIAHPNARAVRSLLMPPPRSAPTSTKRATLALLAAFALGGALFPLVLASRGPVVRVPDLTCSHM